MVHDSSMDVMLIVLLSIFGSAHLVVDATPNNITYTIYPGLLVNTPESTEKARNLRECSTLCSAKKNEANACQSATFFAGSSLCYLSNATVVDTTDLADPLYRTIAQPTPNPTLPSGNYVGTTFYTGFLHNSGTVELQMYFVSTIPTVVNVYIPYLAIDEFFEVNPVVTKVYASTLLHAVDLEQSNKGVYVFADNPITLYKSNNRTTTVDTTLVLPIEGIGTEYAVMTTPNTGENMFLIVGTEDQTTLNITVGTNSTQYTINRLGTFCRKTSGLDGTLIKANKPIAMMSGSSCTVIVGGGCDHVSEILPPTTAFGKDFIVGQMYPRADYTIGILSISADTTVTILTEDGSLYGSITFGVSQVHYSQYLGNTTISLSANNPVMVMQYGHGYWETYVPFGDPSMMFIPSLDRFGTVYELFVPNGPADLANVLEVIIDDEINLRLNGVQVTFQYATSVYTANYGIMRVAYTTVMPGLYTINHKFGSTLGVFWYGGQSYGEFSASLGWL